MNSNNLELLRKPDWVKIRLPKGYKTSQVVGLLNKHGLNTICSSGLCPNKGECWGRGTATFMIGGGICTRNCKFCNVSAGKPKALDIKELYDVIDSVKALHLKHIVITSVDRDDLEDYGVSHWCSLIKMIKEECPGVTMEVLIPDFRGRKDLIDEIISLKPEVISHNMETVRRLTPLVRSVATYDTSLQVISQVAASGIRSKSGIMLGLGETEVEILETMKDLREVGCQVLTIGQYLQPSRQHYPVKEYITPEKFKEYGEIGRELGFRHVESAPLVRSSYKAEKHIL